MELNIYNKEGQLKATVSPADSSSLSEGLMTDYILSLSFVLFDCVQLDVNDYVDFLGKRYWMLEAYIPNQKSTIEWNYNTKFYGIESVIRRALCLKTVDNEMSAVFSLTAPAIEHVRLVVGNINRVMSTTDWKVGEVEATANLTIDYNATYCDAALASIATAADTEYWIDGLTVNLCRCEHGELLSLGYENGLKEITLDTNENAKFFTRLFPLGSTRNIDASKYGSGRLHLPGGVKYVEQNTHYGVIEHSEEAAFSTIYPRRIGVVGEVRKETKKGEDGKDFDIYYFTDPDIDFDPNKYEIGGLVKSIVFETGDLAGRDFEVNYNAEKKEFEVITQWPYGDDMQLPGALVMKPTDEYILYNITMPTEYYSRAEQKFSEAVATYMEKNKRDKSVYKAPTDYIDLNERGIVLTVGQRVHLMSDKYFPPTGYRDSRITKITRKVNETLQADIEISDLANPGGKAVLTQGISEAKHYAQVAMAGLPDMIKSWENTPASDSNLYTAKRTQKEYMSKYRPEQTEHLLKLYGGAIVKNGLTTDNIKVGNFVTGMIAGSGAAVTVGEYGKTTYEGDKMILREELIVPKITFNCTDIISGDKANTFSFGTIKSVDRDNLVATLDLLDDQTGTLHASDICRGVFHNLEGGNQTEDSYDDNGYMNYAGFSTAYFTPTEILESKPGVMSFRYAIQAGTTIHPMLGMNFFGYGNFTDKSRQAITYENRYYTRRLKNVNTWVINPDKHIAMQDGLLEGLTIGGMIMHGHGTYMENCYFTGVQIQFTPQQKEELTGQDAYSVNLSTYESVVVVDDENNILGGYAEEKYVASEGKYVTSEGKYVTAMLSRIKTRIQAFCGSKELYYSDAYHADAYLVNLNPVGCKAIIDNGIVSITEITDFESCYVDISVNCEGNTVFEKLFTIKAVRNGSSAIFADLDNEMSSVACDASGNVLSGLPISTNLSMWYGEKELTIDKVELETPVGVTATSDKGTVTVTEITKDAPGNLQVGITVHATYAGNPYHKRLSLAINKVMPGADGSNAVIYELLTNTNSVKIDESGEFSDASLVCSVVKTDGSNTEVLTSLASDMRIKYSADGSEEMPYTYKSPIVLNGKRKSVKFNLYRNGILVDTENIPIIIDGRSNVTADLDNEMGSVACDVAGNVLSGLPVGTRAMMWYGDRQLPLDKIELSYAQGVTCSADKNTGVIEVTGMTKEVPHVTSVTVKLHVTYAGNQYTRSLTFTVNKIMPGAPGETPVVYQLLPSASSVKVDKEGHYTESALTCSVTLTEGKETKILEALPEGIVMKYQLDGGVEAIYTYGTSLPLREEKKSIKFSLYQNQQLIDVEDIPVILDGSKGQDAQKEETVYILSVYETSIPLPEGDDFTDKYIGECPVYDNNKQYSKGEIVFEGYSHFVCNIACKGIPPSNSAYWQSAYWWGYTQMSPKYTHPYVYSCKRRFDNGKWSEYGEYSLVANYANTATILPSVSQISRTMTGSYMPESFSATFTESNGKHIYGYMGAWGSDDGVYFKNIGTFRETIKLVVDVAANPYKQYVIRTYDRPTTSIVWDTPFIKSVTVNVVSDGKNGLPGNPGGDGPMPIYCGFFDSGETYTYTNTTRDVINYDIDGGTFTFQVKVHGSSVTVPPTSSTGDSNWEPASKMKFVAMDTALIDGANIAGFMYKNLKMISRLGKLDGLEIDIKDVPANRFSEFRPYTVINGRTGDVEFGKATLRGGVSEPFEEYASLEELRNGHSKSWYIKNANTLNGVIIAASEGINGSNLRIFNGSGNTIVFMIPLCINGVIKIYEVTLNNGRLFTAMGMRHSGYDTDTWLLTCPYSATEAVPYKVTVYDYNIKN